MGYKVHFPALSFQRVDPLNPMVPVGAPVTIKRGEDVPAWATPATITALTNAGMIRAVADPEETLIVDEPIAPAMANPEVLPQLGGPSTLEMVASADMPLEPGIETVPPAAAPSEPMARPKEGDNKAAWEAYAESIGIPRTEAESLSKAKLQDRVAQRETEMHLDPDNLAGR